MKKNNTVKRFKFRKRLFFRSTLIQIVILLFLIVGIYESKPIDINDCENKEIIVDAKEYIYVFSEYRCRIYSNGIRFWLPNHSISPVYNPREFYDTIQEGDKLDITYTKYGVRKRNLVVAVKDETTTYLDFDLYNSQKKSAFIAMIVLFAVVELIFCAILYFDIIYTED